MTNRPAQPEDDKPQEQQLELGRGRQRHRPAQGLGADPAGPGDARSTSRPSTTGCAPSSRSPGTAAWSCSGAPSPFAREWTEKKYTQTLRNSLAQFLDTPDVQVRFVISKPDVQPLLGEKPLPLQQAAAPQQTSSRDPA